MQVVFLVWALVLGMKDVLWDGVFEAAPAAAVPASSIPAGSTDVSAADGADNPPPPKP